MMSKPANEGQSPRSWIWEPAIFSVLVLLYLVPIWLFPFLPTQDGPAHVANALILKDYGSEGTRYHEFYEVHLEPLPNWTGHLMLLGFLHFLPPLTAEKVLVSLYVLGFAWSFRYFLGAMGGACRPLAMAGLLLVFQRCFWLGFYNFCLSLIVYWVILGYWLRRREEVDSRHAAVLCVLFLLAYFTHLVGFLLAAGSCLWFGITGPGPRWRPLFWLIISLLPASFLTLSYFQRTGFFDPDGAGRLGNHFLDWFQKPGDNFLNELDSFPRQLFAVHDIQDLLFSLVMLLFAGLAVSSLFCPKPEENRQVRRWPLALFALFLTGLYIFLPDNLGSHGSLIKPRLALVPPLLLLACCRESPIGFVRLGWRTATVLLIVLNLILVTLHIQAGNGDLDEFTAGRSSMAKNRVLFISRADVGSRLVDHLEHAGDYYCLTGGNINVDNHQATTSHFPIRFRPGITRGRGHLESYLHRDAVDVVLFWDFGPGILLGKPGNFEMIFEKGRLQILSRKR